MVLLSVIVPCYNKEKVVYGALEEITKALVLANVEFEMVLVNDASRDGTIAELERFAAKNPRAHIVNLGSNRGKGGALIEGFRHSKGEYVLFADADPDLSPEQIPRFLEYLERFRADVVIGSKNHPDSVVEYPLTRRILSSAYLIMNFILFKMPVSDTQVGLKLFRRDVLEYAVPKMHVKKYAYDLELLVLARHSGFHIKDAPVELKFRGWSGVGYIPIFWMFFDTLAIWYRLKTKQYDMRR